MACGVLVQGWSVVFVHNNRDLSMHLVIGYADPSAIVYNAKLYIGAMV